MHEKLTFTEKLYETDCEGPITLNDNAQELCAAFLKDIDGAKFFAILSKYDDYLADIEKKQGYRAGTTLGLILPFLRAYGATNERIKEYSAKHISLVPGACETIKYIKELMPTFIISTSYKSYVEGVCKKLGIPITQASYTEIDLDIYNINQNDIIKLQNIAQEIAKLEMIDLPEGTTCFNELNMKSKKTITRLNEIFWDQKAHIGAMDCSTMYKQTYIIGGEEKAAAIEKNAYNLNKTLADVMYIGDSITDVEALQKTKEAGGIAVSFNGNRYAVEAAEIVCISDNTYVLAILAAAFKQGGREKVINLIQNWGQGAIEELKLSKNMIPKPLPIVKIISDPNKGELIQASEAMRKEVRGYAIGILG